MNDDERREALKDWACEIILSNGQEPEYLTIAERLDDEWVGFDEMNETEQEQLIDELWEVIAMAKIEVTWPDD